ncbi:hypothetical protein AAMO2058_000142200 [Amorphochlora amoebiformis]
MAATHALLRRSRLTILSNANLRSSLTTATTRQYRGLVVHPGSLRHRGVRYPSTLKNRGFAKARVADLVERVVPVAKPEDTLDLKSTTTSVQSLGIFCEMDDALAELSGPAKELDSALGGVLSSLIQDHDFKAKKGEKVVSLISGFGAKGVALVGLGDEDKASSSDSLESLGATTASIAIDSKAKSALLVAPAGEEFKSLAIGVFSKLYADNRFFTGDNVSKPPKLLSLEVSGADSEAVDAGVSQALCISHGRKKPTSPVKPSSREVTHLRSTIMEEDECKALGMGSYLGVSQGALEKPKFIHLTYTPEGEADKSIALIGKGLTFDSGGYNLKTGAGSMIELMKFDMGGSAAVLGAAQAIGELKPKGIKVEFIVAACENMLSDRAMRPGDILTASNQKTIEVINTDAEGRLTLADALVYAEKLKPDKIVDLATLTGACIISLGNDYAGMWSSDDGLADELLGSAKDAGEKIWRMPLVDGYKEELKSKIADLKNVGGRAGGSITAALFLKEFVEKTPWAHIDMAGPVWDGKAGCSTGFGVKTLVQLVTSQTA